MNNESLSHPEVCVSHALNSLVKPVIIVDLQGNLLYANSAAILWTGQMQYFISWLSKKGLVSRRELFEFVAADGTIKKAHIHIQDTLWEASKAYWCELTPYEDDNEPGDLLVSEKDWLGFLVKDSELGVALTDLKGKYVWVNDAYCRLMNRTRLELLSYTREDAATTLNGMLTKSIEKEQNQQHHPIFRYEKATQKTNGQEQWVDISGYLMLDKKHMPIYILRLMVEISSRQQATTEMEQITRRMDMIREIERSILSANSVDEICSVSTERLRGLMNCERVSVVIYDRTTEQSFIKAVASPLPSRMGTGTSFRIDVARIYTDYFEHRSYYSIDLRKDELKYPWEHILAEEGFWGYLCIPLLVRGSFLGMINCCSTQRDKFLPQEINVALEVAYPLAIGLHQANLYEETARRADELSVITKVSASLRKATNRSDMVDIFLSSILDLTNSDFGVLFLENSGDLQYCYSRGILESRVEMVINRDKENIFWRVFQNGESLYIPDLPRWRPMLMPENHSIMLENVQALGIIPLKTPQKTIGLMCVASFHAIDITLQQQRLVSAIVDMAGNALYRNSIMDLLEKRVRDRTRELAALYDITVMANEAEQVDDFLHQLLEKVLVTANCQAGVIGLMDERGGAIQSFTQQGLDPIHEENIRELIQGWQNKTTDLIHQNIFIPREREENTSNVMEIAGFPVSVVSTIKVKNQLLGFLLVFRQAALEFTVEDMALLSAIADQLGAAVETARLRKSSREAAALEERQRLARELHDSVTQSLYSMTLFSQAAKDYLAEQDIPSLSDCLNGIYEGALQSLRHMRLLLYELRPQLLQQEGLVHALQFRLDSVERRAGIQASLVVEGEIEISSEIAEEVFLILTEALNNALKHALPTKVKVALKASPENVQFSVQDDGVGFDPSCESNGGMGLAGMRLRANHLHGDLKILSTMGEGTLVLLILPSQAEKRS